MRAWTGAVSRRRAALAGVAGLAMACGGCNDYLARRDTASAGSGDAVQANMVVHVIDPWSRPSRRIDHSMDGERLAHAMERYRNPTTATFGGAPAGAPLGAPSAPLATPAAAR